jgi:hypothetical protein
MYVDELANSKTTTRSGTIYPDQLLLDKAIMSDLDDLEVHAASSSDWEDDECYEPPPPKTKAKPQNKYENVDLQTLASASFSRMKAMVAKRGKTFQTREAAIAHFPDLQASELCILYTDDKQLLKALWLTGTHYIVLTPMEETRMIHALCEKHGDRVHWKRWKELSKDKTTNNPMTQGTELEKKIFGSIPGCIFLSSKLANAAKTPALTRPKVTPSKRPVEATASPVVPPPPTPKRKRVRATKPTTTPPIALVPEKKTAVQLEATQTTVTTVVSDTTCDITIRCANLDAAKTVLSRLVPDTTTTQ